MVTWLLGHWRAVVIGVAILVLAIGGVRWCRRPPPFSVKETTKPAKDKIDRATEDRLKALVKDRERELAKQRVENTRLREAAEARATVPFDTAVKGGTHAMAELATLWTAPGTTEQLRARWRATADPANPGR